MKASGTLNIILLPMEKYKRAEILRILEQHINNTVAPEVYNKFGVVCKLWIEEIEEEDHDKE